jgi:hypothetical protein
MNTMCVALNRRLSVQNAMNGGRQTCAKVFTFDMACFISTLYRTSDRNVQLSFVISNLRCVLNAVFFIWVITRRPNFMYRRFGTLCSIFIVGVNNINTVVFRSMRRVDVAVVTQL